MIRINSYNDFVELYTEHSQVQSVCKTKKVGLIIFKIICLSFLLLLKKMKGVLK